MNSLWLARFFTANTAKNRFQKTLLFTKKTPQHLPEEKKTHLFLTPVTYRSPYTDVIFHQTIDPVKNHKIKNKDSVLGIIIAQPNGSYHIYNASKNPKDIPHLIQKAHEFCKPKIGSFDGFNQNLKTRKELRKLTRDKDHLTKSHLITITRQYSNAALSLATNKTECTRFLEKLFNEVQNHPFWDTCSLSKTNDLLNIELTPLNHSHIGQITFRTTKTLTSTINTGYKITYHDNTSLTEINQRAQNFVTQFFQRPEPNLSLPRHLIAYYMKDKQ